MKQLLIVCIALFCNIFISFSRENMPGKEANPKDTVKVYYLDEVVVTSSVKETNELKNMPTAVSVVSPKQLRDTQIESLPGLSAYIPNFFIPVYGSKVSTPIYIRGIGARLGAQTVSMYVDNVPSFNPSAFDFEFQDIQRVEVLRGAQGTLYGRNAIGGIVNLYTFSPLTFQGTNLMVGGGNYGQFSAKVSNYSKLADNFGISVGGYYKRDDGYFTNSYTGKKVDASENAGGRVKFEWELTPSFKALLFGNYDYVSGGAFPYMHKDSTASNFNEPSSYDRHLFTNGLSLDYSGKGYSIHSTTGYQYLKDDMKMDQDYSPKSVFSIRQMQKQHSLSQEITVKSDSQRKYRWVLGAFGFYDHRVIDTPVAIKKEGIAAMQAHLDAFTAKAPLTISYANDQIDLPGVYTKPSRGAAFFHQSTVNDLFGVTGLSGTAGIRFDYEHTGLDFFTESEGGDVNLQFNIPNRPMPSMFIEGDTLLTGSYSKDFWKILPKFALQYQFTPTAHIYLSASKGYKTGGYNEQVFSKILQGALAASIMEGIAAKMPPNMPMPGGAPNGDGTKPTLEEQLSYDPETSWTYELGGRYEMFENSLSLNYALFYSRVNNIQIIKLEDQGTSGRTVKNAGKSESKGFELSLKYVPLQNLSLYADYGFADARFVDYEAAEDVDYSGNHIPFAPRHTVSLGTSYVHNFANGSLIDRLSGNIQYAGVGKIYWTESNKTTPQDGGEGVELYQPFYGLVNGSISAERGAFSLELWAKNLFNTDYHSFLFEASDMTTGKVNQFVQRGYPTRFGATLRYTIGR
ncbi:MULTISPECIES: TonB-dependent receptor [Proteiniphilum]|uniref:TonB-dependent receptor n=6 Tax=Bacteria TaxID=2 RepID=UPI001EECBF2A|nr:MULTISPECIES: TonB-dependent receptor [Proteiniphilum]ULB34926.1 TonB-dependent receptor [Proteiniphilum propionicum]